MRRGEAELDDLDGRLRRAEHALLRAVPQRALRAMCAAHLTAPDSRAHTGTGATSAHLADLLVTRPTGPDAQPPRCSLCHDRLDGRGGASAHFKLGGGSGPRCSVFPAIIEIMSDCAAKRAQDRLERERWRSGLGAEFAAKRPT